MFSFWSRYIWIHFLSLCLASVSIFQNCKYYHDILLAFNRIKDKYTRRYGGTDRRSLYKSKIKKIDKRNEKYIHHRVKKSHSINYDSLANSENPSFVHHNDKPKESKLFSLPNW